MGNAQGFGAKSHALRFFPKVVTPQLAARQSLETLGFTKHVILKLLHWVLSLNNVGSVSFPEHQWAEELPNIIVTPMLAKNVRRILGPTDEMKTNKSRGNCFTNTVKRQCSVSLVKLSMDLGGTVDN